MLYADNYECYEETYPCHECSEAESKAVHAADYMQGVIDILYGKEAFDACKLETYLDEVSSALGVKLPECDLQVVKKDAFYNRFCFSFLNENLYNHTSN